MATKRTSKTIGNKHITTTTTRGRDGRITTTRSESTAGVIKPGQTRITTTVKNGKTDTIRTTNLGLGWFQRTSGAGEDRRRQAQANKNAKANGTLLDLMFGKSKSRSTIWQTGWLIAIVVFALIVMIT